MKKNILSALIGISIGGIGFGLITPVTVLLLERNNAPALLTGFVTMVGYLSVVLFSPLTGKLIDKYNVKLILLIGLTLWSFGALGHIFWYIYPLLFPIKFLMGIGGTFIFVSTEVMINYFSDESNRGKNIGLYVVLLSAGVAVGTLLIWIVEIADWLPFVIGSGIMFIVLAFQFYILEDFEFHKSQSGITKMPIKEIPLIGLLAGIIYGLFESSIIVALPLFGIRNNFTTNEVSYFLASFVIGGIVLLYFIGNLADKFNKYKLLLGISFILGILLLIPLFVSKFLLLMAAFFFMGGIVPAFYTVGLNYTVENVDKQFIAQANGYFVMMYGIGTIAGPLAGSMMVEINKEIGYWSFASTLCIIFFLVFKFYRRN